MVTNIILYRRRSKEYFYLCMEYISKKLMKMYSNTKKVFFFLSFGVVKHRT